ncbi:MAG: Crp/Fnr family transcriptional regulator [Gammaproteobacteria bacterium]|nr:Crp/Fnr family transcriptional regulator [Gammaproteobacteria bacterium]
MPVIDELRTCFLFADLDEEQLRRVDAHAVRIRLGEGDALFQQGDVADRFYLVTSGQIKLFRLSPAGNEKVIDVVTPGNTFAEALMFLERPHYPVGAEALQSSTVVSIDAVDFANMLKDSVKTCFVLMGSMSQRLRAQLREIDELSLHSATCRVAAYLVQHAPTDADSFDLPVAKQIVASRLSVKPETFSRIIKSLTDGGMIRVAGSRVTIRDRDALSVVAETCLQPPDF